MIQINGDAAFPPGQQFMPSTTPEEQAQIDATPTHLCRLGCLGRADVWAFGCAAQVYLQDQTEESDGLFLHALGVLAVKNPLYTLAAAGV